MFACKISVIIPVYNAEKYINRCVDSILGQTLKSIEIILVDDQSTDNTPRICDEYASNNSNIKVVHKENEGPGFARNNGILVAEGEFIAFVDADDYIDPFMYEKMYHEIMKVKADSCICGFKKIDENKEITNVPNPMGNQVFEQDDVRKHILLNILGSMPTEKKDHIIGLSVWKNLYSSSLIKKNNIKFYSERRYYSEDTLFNIDYFLQAEKVVTMEDMFYYYVENSTSFTKNYKEDMHIKNIRFYCLALDKIVDIPEYKEAKVRLDRLFFGFVRYYLQRIVELYNMRTAIQQISDIVNDAAVISIIKEYPYKRNPIKQRMIHHMIYKRQAAFIWSFIYWNYFFARKNNIRLKRGIYEKNLFYSIFRRAFRRNIET